MSEHMELPVFHSAQELAAMQNIAMQQRMQNMGMQRTEALANAIRTPVQRKLDAAKAYLREIGGARPGVLARFMAERGKA